MLEPLGCSRREDGVGKAHTDRVGSALLMTMSEALGAAFTPDIRAAWTSLDRDVSRVMRAGAA
jgi:hemoglobin-like flavoprotein